MPSEAEFTAPTSECPNPELWWSPDGQSTEREVSWLVQAFIMALKPERVIETGTAYGKTTVEIGNALWSNGRGELVSLEIDPVLVEHSRSVLKSLKRELPVRVLQESSLHYTPEGPVDFVWFDSLTHLRVIEFKRFYPYFHHRTVVGFHDTGPQHHPLRPQIEQLAAEGLLQPLFLPTPRGVCFGRVLGAR